MKTLINQSRFIKAVEYASRHHFSKPFSISPMVGRWFNQLSMIELENGKLLHLSGALARECVDITLDGQIVDKKDIGLIFRFCAQDSQQEQERAAINESMTKLEKELEGLPDNDENKAKYAELAAITAQLQSFDRDKARANELYLNIVSRGTSSLNQQRIEEKYHSKIKNIIHRPNHGLTHSVRVAYMTTAIHAFKQRYGLECSLLSDDELEKQQLMMLFSVVGRQDETGFNDTGANEIGRQTYERFRVASGREYLKYCLQDLQKLYGNNLEAIYRDAIIVELMGYSSIEDCLSRRKSPPEVFVDYVIAMEGSKGHEISSEEAIALILTKKYSLSNLFPQGPVRTLANAKMEMMNSAHAIDLVRIYPLKAAKVGGANSSGIFNSYLIESGLYQSLEHADIQKLTSAFQIMRCSFDTLALTGQNSMFGLISNEEFEAQKSKIIQEIDTINARFAPPIAAESKTKFLEEASKVRKELANLWNIQNADQLLECYRNYLILNEVIAAFTKAPKLNPDKSMFQFQHHSAGDHEHVDHRQNAVRLVNALQTITPMPGVTQIELPVITEVEHIRASNKAIVIFDTEEQAELLQSTYETLFLIKPEITVNSEGQFTIEINRTDYHQLVTDRLVEFKVLSIPEAITLEEQLVDDNGMINALALIAYHQALVRLVSTSALGGESFPDYDYLFRSLEDPIHNRYSPALRDLPKFPIDHGKYYDPRNGNTYIRKLMTSPLPELRFQEPITKPISFADRLADGLLTSPLTSSPINTLFAPKSAHTLLPGHGKITPFDGYSHKKFNYFPIGVLSDRRKVDLKDERYVWSSNMTTTIKFWIRDPSAFEKSAYKLLHAKRDDDNNLIRFKTGVVSLDKDKLHDVNSPVLIKYIEGRAEKIIEKIDNKFYRPSDAVLQDFKMLLRQERKEYLDKLKASKRDWHRLSEAEREVKNVALKQAVKDIKRIYGALEERLTQEEHRKHPKYAISIRELIELQKKADGVDGHNEILASNTKEATRALYASKDTLLDRLNLAFHASQIKKKYLYDIPLLVLSADKAPYHYTEAMIEADLKLAYQRIRENNFPFDTSLFPVYELDSSGSPLVDSTGRFIVKTDKAGHELMQPKNLQFQKDLLLDIFKIGAPDLKTFEELSSGTVNGLLMDGKLLEIAIDFIMDEFDVLGRLKRETELMEHIFATEDSDKKQAFFLRCAALGHRLLLEDILYKKGFKAPKALFEKAIKFAEKNDHQELASLLTILSELDQPSLIYNCSEETLITQLKGQIDLLVDCANKLSALPETPNSAQINPILTEKMVTLLLNPLSTNERNKADLFEFILLLKGHPDYLNLYAHILKTNQAVKLDDFITHHQLGTQAAIQAIALDLINQDPSNRSFLDKDLIVSLIENGAFYGKNLEHACTVFNQDEALILAAYSKNMSSLQFADEVLIIELIKADKINPEEACKAFPGSSVVLLAAYAKNTAVLQYADSDVVALMVMTGQVDPYEACKGHKNNEDVVLAAYNSKPESIKFAALSLLDTLVKKGDISSKHVSEVFPQNAHYIQIRQFLQSLIKREIQSSTGYIYNTFTEQQISLLNTLNKLIVQSYRGFSFNIKNQKPFLDMAYQVMAKLYQTNPDSSQKEKFDAINNALKEVANSFFSLNTPEASGVNDPSTTLVSVTEQAKLKENLSRLKGDELDSSSEHSQRT